MKKQHSTTLLWGILIMLLLASILVNTRDIVQAKEKGNSLKEILEDYIGKEVFINAFTGGERGTLKEIGSDYFRVSIKSEYPERGKVSKEGLIPFSAVRLITPGNIVDIEMFDR